jgi:hypothetical protein
LKDYPSVLVDTTILGLTYNFIGNPGIVYIGDLFPGAGAVESSDTTPIPPALPMFVAGLGAMGLLGRRRKRKNTVAIAAA